MRNMGINVWNCFWTCHLKGCDFSRDLWQGMKCLYICVSILSFRSLHIPDPITLTDLEKTALHILSGFWLDWSFLHCSLLSLTRNHSFFATVLLLAHFFNIALQNCPKETMGIIDFSFLLFVIDAYTKIPLIKALGKPENTGEAVLPPESQDDTSNLFSKPDQIDLPVPTPELERC